MKPILPCLYMHGMCDDMAEGMQSVYDPRYCFSSLLVGALAKSSCTGITALAQSTQTSLRSDMNEAELRMHFVVACLKGKNAQKVDPYLGSKHQHQCAAFLLIACSLTG